MKYLIGVFLLILVACCSKSPLSPLSPDSARQFVLNSSNQLTCPKCGSKPKSIKYKSKKDIDTGSGANDFERFDVICGQCEFLGWSTLENGKSAVQASQPSAPHVGMFDNLIPKKETGE